MDHDTWITLTQCYLVKLIIFNCLLFKDDDCGIGNIDAIGNMGILNTSIVIHAIHGHTSVNTIAF